MGKGAADKESSKCPYEKKWHFDGKKEDFDANNPCIDADEYVPSIDCTIVMAFSEKGGEEVAVAKVECSDEVGGEEFAAVEHCREKEGGIIGRGAEVPEVEGKETAGVNEYEPYAVDEESAPEVGFGELLKFREGFIFCNGFFANVEAFEHRGIL